MYAIRSYYGRIKKDPLVFFRILKLARKFQPDIIHSWGSMPSIYTFLIAKLLRARFINAMITNARHKTYGPEWWRAKITFPFSDAIASNSYAGLREYGVSGKKGVVLYNGFAFDRLLNLEAPEAIRQEFALHTPYVVAMVGAFHPRKRNNFV